MNRIAPTLAVALLSGAAAAQANPSFDCSKASTTVEETICEDNNEGLAMRDGALARLYAALKEQGGHENLLKEQPGWLKSRDTCGSDTQCLEARYDERIRALAKAAGDEAGVSGSYGYQLSSETDQGTLWAVREADGTLTGMIETVSGPSYHTCDIGFDAACAMGDAWLWVGPKEEASDGGECHILFRPGRQSMRVDSFDCRYYCGANGWFDETYKRSQ